MSVHQDLSSAYKKNIRIIKSNSTAIKLMKAGKHTDFIMPGVCVCVCVCICIYVYMCVCVYKGCDKVD